MVRGLLHYVQCFLALGPSIRVRHVETVQGEIRQRIAEIVIEPTAPMSFRDNPNKLLLWMEVFIMSDQQVKSFPVPVLA